MLKYCGGSQLKVRLHAYTQDIDEYGEHATTDTMLSYIASQSRNEQPKMTTDLFKRTIEWGHESLQEFVDFVFHVEDVSRVLLAQLTRHRIASFNVQSGRHTHPHSGTVPKGVRVIFGTVCLVNGNYVEWELAEDGSFTENAFDINNDEMDIADVGIPIEDIRYGYPNATHVNLFMKFNGRSLRNFLKLRMEKHAQWEIRELANKVYDIVEKICPTLLMGLPKNE
jgi:thymidylate synthase (FAD)